MTENSVVRARIDEHTKEEATAILKSIGLTPSDAFRMMMLRIVKERALPFDPMVPNEETIAAIREAKRGNLPRFNSIDALMDDLRAGD